MQYRPVSQAALRAAVELARKNRLRERYLGDLIWLAAKSQYKQFSLMPYSDYDDLLEGKIMSTETEKERIGRRVDEMLNMYV